MVLKKLHKAIRKFPDPMEDETTMEHCRNCNGDCPLINGCS